MSRLAVLSLLLVFISLSLQAQTFTLKGKITDNKLEPLAFASIQIKQFHSGTISRQDGSYQLSLEADKYDLVISMTGYTTQVITVTVNRNTTQNVILEREDPKSLSEITVKARTKDRAEEVIRRVIDHKEEIMQAAGPYSVKMYIKGVQYDSGMVASRKKSKADTVRRGDEDLSRMAMAEISLKLDIGTGQQYREERLGVKKNGNAQSLFYLSATEGNFSFYNNLVKVPAISTIPFLSPVSYSGLIAYKYRTVSTQQNGRFKTWVISVRPRQISNATVEGEITISDSAWVITHTRLRFPRYHLPEYDFFEVEQQYSLVQNKAFMLSRQQFSYYSKSGKQKLSGNTLVTYSDYELNKQFPPHYFGTEVSATTQLAYEQDSSFWNQARTEPLTAQELRFVRYRDSLYRATHTRQYLDSVDRLTNKITWQKMTYLGQTFYNRKKERTWFVPPVLSLYQPLAFGGTRINPFLFYSKIYPSKKNLYANINLSYGLRNHDVNGSVSVTRMYNPFNRGFYRVSLKRDFEFIYSGDAWINLLKRSNFYLNNAVGIGHGLEIKNGLFLYSDLDIALRRSVGRYKIGSLVDSLFGNILDNNRPVYFEPYNAVYGKLRLQYTPFQRYIREPKEKVILGSSWPTFYTMWRKGIPKILSSKINFDYLEFGIEQEVHVGLLGVSRYNVKTGSFLNKKELQLVDYQFQRRGDPFLFMNPDEAFQALDSTFALFKRFYQAHYVHEFNGSLINRIPLLKKLQLREVAGGGFLIAPERHLRYVEAFGGIERVFKWPFSPMTKFKLGVYMAGSAANRFTSPVQFKIGITSWDKTRNRWY
ncbi:MAG: carboxypeptidase-like regulatory domain-containing protein [Williamsia sp.]|nr:carboxypeptidase-like regulatory domain-containing protein [Williamsia sp.]